MGLQDKLDEYKKSFLAKAPPEAVEVMQRATEDLKNSGILNKILKAGPVCFRPKWESGQCRG